MIVEILQAVLHTRSLNLLYRIMVGLCLEVVLQMGPQNVLEKGVALLNSIPLHDDTVLHPQSAHLVDLTIMVEEMFKKGIIIGIQAIEIIPIAHRKDATEAHQEPGALPDTAPGEVEVGASLAAQVLTETVTEALYAVLAL